VCGSLLAFLIGLLYAANQLAS